MEDFEKEPITQSINDGLVSVVESVTVNSEEIIGTEEEIVEYVSQ